MSVSSELRLRVRAPAPLAAVHRALTDAGALRIWLAEHAEVALPHRYAFWGRYTPEGAEPRQRPLHVDDAVDGATVRFAWPLGGADTVTAFTLAPDGPQSTVVALAQSHAPTFGEMLAGDGIRSVLPTFWALSLSNLVDHVSGREPTPKCDFTSPRMAARVLIAAPPAEVFASLLDPAKFRAWFGANVDIEPHVGGRFAMGGFAVDPAPARIVSLEPGRRFGLDWGGLQETWELEGSEGGTRLTFVHSGFDDDRPPYGSWLGSLGGLGELRRFHELPRWAPAVLAMEVPGMPAGMLAAR